MAAVGLNIVQPVNGAYIAGDDPVQLRGELQSGSAAGLFFKWYSTMNPAATESHPELNAADHGAAILAWATPLELGTHVITLAAADREGNDLASIQAITRAGSAGGPAAPANSAPCVVHRLRAVWKTPSANGASVSKASATLEMRAPALWAKEEYQDINGIRFRFRFAPNGPPDAAKTAEIIPGADAFDFFFADDKPYLRWHGALPGNLGTGAYLITLFVESLDGTVGHPAVRGVILTA